jgi:hypothetical protein
VVVENGLKISSNKIEYIVVGKDEDIANVSLINEQWKKVHNSKCLRSNIRSDGTVDYKIATECQKMLSADHVHQETLVLPI